MSSQIKRIAIVGPESTGKSSITKVLAQHFNTNYVAEMARAYLTQQNNEYVIDDLDAIAESQFSEMEKQSHLPLVFIDTEMYVMKIWSELKYNSCSATIIHLLAKQNIDAFLLMDIDLPWCDDPQREYPNTADREKLMHYYIDHISYDGRPFAIIKGVDADRNSLAIATVENWIHLP